jgi:inosine/xanthosine triphosphate pyrophosphatase family protein
MTLPSRIVFASNNTAKTADVAKFFKLYGIELVNYRELIPAKISHQSQLMIKPSTHGLRLNLSIPCSRRNMS